MVSSIDVGVDRVAEPLYAEVFPVAVEEHNAKNYQHMVEGLVPAPFDFVSLTYVASGNGKGEIETATYKTGGSGGTTVATVTLTYNTEDCIATITRV